MIVTESEAKDLLRNAGITLPPSLLVNCNESTSLESISFPFPVMVKAQVLHGNRAQQGLVLQANDEQELKNVLEKLCAARDAFGQEIRQVLLEQAVTFAEQHYLALTYETQSRSLVARYSSQGGVGMDDRGGSLHTTELSAQEAPQEFPPNPEVLPLLQQLHAVFLQHDATLLEINPLVKTDVGWMCLDAKMELEDSATWRHPEWDQYASRSGLGRAPTPLEERAHAVSRSDHRGVAGESFFEFSGGEIGVMASGGGASTLAMDALLAEGLSPANYTEYSGNPTREKVRGLAEVVLSIPGLRGLYVVGSNANFTDIYETLAGVVDGLLESPYASKPGFAVLVRRGGPRWQEAFTMMEERLAGTGVKLKLLGPDFPLVETAREMRLLVESSHTPDVNVSGSSSAQESEG